MGNESLAKSLLLMATACITSLLFASSSLNDPYIPCSPDPELKRDMATHQESVHSRLILRFRNMPDGERRNILSEKGIQLLRHLGGISYPAYLQRTGLRTLPTITENKDIKIPSPETKLSPLFDHSEGLLQGLDSCSYVKVRIRFHEDVAFDSACDVLEKLGIKIAQNRFHYFNVIETEACKSQIRRLAAEDHVQWIAPSLPPPRPLNSTAASRANVHLVYKKKSYKKPTGKGIVVGVWDEGRAGNHMDLGNRVINVQKSKAVSDHTTHVCGTIAGGHSAAYSAMGMAPAAKIFVYDYHGDVIGEIGEARDKYGIMIANCSWGSTAGWEWEDISKSAAPVSNIDIAWYGDQWFGLYDSGTEDLDRFIFENNFPVVWSVGDDRDDSCLGPHYHGSNRSTVYQDLHPPDPEYGSILPYSTAKNVISVGATMKDDYELFTSNWGPTSDGRIKPEIVAAGYKLRSTLPNNYWGNMSGSSSACAVVTGASALLMHSYQRFYKKDMPADVLKGILIHTARDLGRSGPDYEYGYGMIDAELAAKVIQTSASNLLATAGEAEFTMEISSPGYDLSSRIIEGNIDNKKLQAMEVIVPKLSKELRVTLIWNDPQGDALVNDLDIWAVSPSGGKLRPFTLKPKRPKAAAKRKRNPRDNAEHVQLEKPEGGSWKFYVKGKKVPQGPQRYVLIISAGAGNTLPEIKTEGKALMLKVWTGGSDSTEKTSFIKGDDFSVWFNFRPVKNPNYGTYYGTVIHKWVVFQGKKVILRQNYGSDRTYPTPTSYWRSGWSGNVIPNGLAAGIYTYEGSITMANGLRIFGRKTFTVK